MEYYDEVAEGYDELYREEQEAKLEVIKQYFKPKGLLLDIGAGTGISSEDFKDCEIILLDPSIEMLKKADFGMKVVGRAENLPFKDNTFDAVISLTALHLADFKKAMEEINRVSKDDAKICLSFLKKSKNLPVEIDGYKKIEEEKDIIFIKN